jgi:hypothetical protein
MDDLVVVSLNPADITSRIIFYHKGYTKSGTKDFT